MHKPQLFPAVLIPIAILSSACGGLSQEALLDAAAKLVIEKYEKASCEEVATMQPSGNQETEDANATVQTKAIELLKNNPDLREDFINRVSGPIANRMFECDLVP